MKLNHQTLHVTKNKDARKFIVSGISKDIHNWWRKFRLLDNTEDTYTVRWKPPHDSFFEDYWKTKLKPGEQLSVQKRNDWKIYIDIANTHANQLSNYWKKTNKDVAEFSFWIILNELSDFWEINNELKDKISVIIHDYWRKNNPWLNDHFLFWTEWKRLIEIKYGNVSKEYIDFIRKNKDAQKMWEELSYELKPWFWANIYEASDEQIKLFLIEQVDFDLKKDLDKFIQTFEIAKKTTKNDFSKLKNLKDEIIESSIIFMHEIWRKDRLLDEEWTYLTRWKLPESEEFEKFWDEQLWLWDSISVSMNDKSEIKIDIANTTIWMLTKYWQESSLNSANFSVNFISDAIQNNTSINANFALFWWVQLHNHWLSNHPEAKWHFIMWQSWEFLLEIFKGNIPIEFINKVRNDKNASHTFKLYASQIEWIPHNIIKASDEQIRVFLIKEAKFNLQKDTNITLYAIDCLYDNLFMKYRVNYLLNILNWNNIVWYLSNQEVIVDINEIKNWIVSPNLFYNNFEELNQKASDFKINWKSLNEKWSFCTSYEKLESYSNTKLKELWIINEEDYKVFVAYKKYVKDLEEKIKEYIDKNSLDDRNILDSLLNELENNSGNISQIGTTLNSNNVIENGNHNNIPLKKIDRIMEKVLSHWFFDWDFRKVSDVVRWTLEFDNIIDLYNWLEDFLNLEYFKLWNSKILIKDNIWNPLWDALNSQKYRDINCIIKLHNWHTVELQFQLKPMLQANNKWIQLKNWTIESLWFTQKEREYVVKIASKIKKPKIRIPKDDFVIWHEIYEIWRSISSKDENQKELKDKLNNLLMILHDEAWNQSLYSRNPETELKINSYEMNLRKSINYLLSPEDMEKDFLKMVRSNFSQPQAQKIIDTIKLIKEKHNWQYRDEHTEYYTHCVHTAFLCLQDWWNFEDILICLLHDILEDSNISQDELKKLYGKEISNYVFLLSKSINWVFLYKDDEEYYETLRNNPVVIKYKAYDRLSNIISLYFSPENYSEKYKQKTQMQLIPILKDFIPDIVEKYYKVFKFLDKHKISEDEQKIVDNLLQIRIIKESIKNS